MTQATNIVQNALDKSYSSIKSARIIGISLRKLIAGVGLPSDVNLMRRIHLIFLYFLLISQFLGCKSLYDFRGYSKSSVKGYISGSEWNYVYAYTNPEAKLAEGQEIMIVLATGKPKHACPDADDKLPDPREVAVAIDGKPGEMKIGAPSDRLETNDDAFTYRKVERQASVAFIDPSKAKDDQYKFATSGKVKITKINMDSIEGAIVAKVNKTMFINGRFKAKVCKYGQLN